MAANSAVISQVCEKVWPTLQPKKPLLPPLPLRFKVYGFDFVLVAARRAALQLSPGKSPKFGGGSYTIGKVTRTVVPITFD